MAMPKAHKRYLYSVGTPDDVVVHDTQHLQEDCNTDQIEDGDRRYGDDLALLLRIKNAHACGHCLANEAR